MEAPGRAGTAALGPFKCISNFNRFLRVCVLGTAPCVLGADPSHPPFFPARSLPAVIERVFSTFGFDADDSRFPSHRFRTARSGPRSNSARCTRPTYTVSKNNLSHNDSAMGRPTKAIEEAYVRPDSLQAPNVETLT